MAFNLDKYRSIKKEVIYKIKLSHAWETTEGFIADGLISPKKYSEEEVKIACVLSETYGYNASGVVDIELQQSEDILGVGDANIKATTKLPALLWLLFESLKTKQKIEFVDVPRLFTGSDENLERLKPTMTKIGWVNAKKASKPVEFYGKGSKQQSNREIYENTIRNKDVLKLQLESMKPDLLIICGSPVIMGFANSEILGKGIEFNKKKVIQVNDLGEKIMLISHPSSAREWSYEKLYSRYEVLFEHFK